MPKTAPDVNLLSDLNPAQTEAVTHKSGPLLIVAGAGTGKTTVITRRVAWLIEQGLAKAEEILALTFTDKAATEMEERVDKLLPMGYVNTWISTFHSFGERILKDYALEIGLTADFRVLTQTEQWMLVRNNLDKFKLDYYRPLGNPTKFIHALLQHFSRAKDEAVYPEDYLEFAESKKLDSGAGEYLKKGKVSAQGGSASGGKSQKSIRQPADKNQKLKTKTEKKFAIDIIDEGEAARLLEVAEAYLTYQQLLLHQGALDFGDLINYTLKLFRTRPTILRQLQQQFKFILVDEFQDTNYAQYELVKLLAVPRNNLTVVGDDDQCLPGATRIKLPRGEKLIKNIKVGDEVLTAVGRGHLGVSKVINKFVNHRLVRYLIFKTQRRYRLKVTDNHKMFCRVPAVGKTGYWYVYLMERLGLGWRLGVTNDLAARLRLERSADRIIALKAFGDEQTARYYETLWSLRYGIPTVCFKTSRGRLTIDDKFLLELYKNLKVAVGVKKLAQDLKIDLASHHVALAGVVRGQKRRIKIYFDLCYRNYRAKSGTKVLAQARILHQLSLDTSDRAVVTRLSRAGYELKKAKKGYRLRITSADIKRLGAELARLEFITGGLCDYRFQVARVNKQHLASLIMPAKNICLGMYLPVVSGGQVIYDQVIDIKEQYKVATIYDLEVERTHNFIANKVVVHNSIYKFRGASIANILEFKHDYPQSREVFLTVNYRSQQNILDTAYEFIQLNNPYRLEVKLREQLHNISSVAKPRTESSGDARIEDKKNELSSAGVKLREQLHNISSVAKPRTSLMDIESGTRVRLVKKGQSLSKKLKSAQAGTAEIVYNCYGTADEEARAVVQKIIELQAAGASWSDFAILVRANSSAPLFIQTLKMHRLPFDYVANKGLYSEAIILDVISYLKLLDNYHESSALYRVLAMEPFALAPGDLAALTHYANRKTISLYEALSVAATIGLPPASLKIINNLSNLLAKHSALARQRAATEVYVHLIQDLGINERVSHPALVREASYLNTFYQRLQRFEVDSGERHLRQFLEYLTLELESGEEGQLPQNYEEGPETVKVITVHSAKGLEWRYVFIVQLIDRRFPSLERREPIELPLELIKETLPEGDVHLPEERRLFYVAMTRAKQGLYLSRAEDYFGKTTRKPSRFLYELGLIDKPEPNQKPETLVAPVAIKINRAAQYPLPASYSFTSVSAFRKCPLEFKYRFLLKLPVPGTGSMSFGSTIHKTLEEFLKLWQARQRQLQSNLFGAELEVKVADLPTLDELLKLYHQSWVDDWYPTVKDKEIYRTVRGPHQLRNFYNEFVAHPPQPKYLERFFKIALGPYKFVGKIDRLDQVGGGGAIIDYKTGGESGKGLAKVDRDQLIIYQIAAEEFLREHIIKAQYWYLEANKFSEAFLATPAEVAQLKGEYIEDINKIVQTIANNSFLPAHEQTRQHDCKYLALER